MGECKIQETRLHLFLSTLKLWGEVEVYLSNMQIPILLGRRPTNICLTNIAFLLLVPLNS